jgi:hypothetical protein
MFAVFRRLAEGTPRRSEAPGRRSHWGKANFREELSTQRADAALQALERRDKAIVIAIRSIVQDNA